jgi:sigma-E factor negative regulatory protein RseC
MIDARGTIVAVDGEFAIVSMEKTGCGRCHERGGCGGNNIGQMFCGAPRTFRVLNSGHSAVGDQVDIAIADGAVRRSAALAYGFPLLALFVGALGGSELAGETGAIIGALIALLGACLTLHYAHSRGSAKTGSQPYIRY